MLKLPAFFNVLLWRETNPAYERHSVRIIAPIQKNLFKKLRGKRKEKITCQKLYVPCQLLLTTTATGTNPPPANSTTMHRWLVCQTYIFSPGESAYSTQNPKKYQTQKLPILNEGCVIFLTKKNQWEARIWSCGLRANQRPQKKLHEKGTDIYIYINWHCDYYKESA